MKRIVPVLLTVGLVATWSGCKSETDTSVPASQAGAENPAANESTDGEFVLVTLKVPHMT